jgi:predicted nucleotidyltransferase
MDKQVEILEEMKLIILQHVPDATIYLFGSRASGREHEESDWDILILTEKKYPKSMRWQIQDALFPLSMRLQSFIDITLVAEEDWQSNPAYYCLKTDISRHKSLAL